MTKKRLLSLLLTAVLILGLFAGCGATESAAPAESVAESVTESASEAPAVETTEDVPVEEATQEESAVPVEEPTTTILSEEPAELELFITIPDHIKQYINKMEDLDGFTEAEKLTNVHVSCITASNETLTDNFNLMVASGDYPDLCRDVATNYSGGLAKALADEFIIDISEDLAAYAPDYMEYVSQDETIAKSVVADSGQHLAVYSVSSGALVEQGWIIRQDYLDQVGMDVPVTVADWEKVLTAFRDELGLSDPMLLRPNLDSIASAWGVADYMAEGSNPMNFATWLYNEDGVVKSVFLEDGYKEFLETMNEWYETGLVNKDFVSRGSERDAAYASVYLSGQAGIFYCNNLSDMKAENFEGGDAVLTAIPYPVLEEGDINQFGAKRERVRNESISVTSGCENVELATKWLNFWFTDPGVNLANYGIQGKSWDYDENGNWQYTDLILNNPDGMSEFECRAYFGLEIIPTKLDPTRAASAYGDFEWGCIDVWESTSTAAWRLLSAYALNEEEAEVYNAHATDIETYGMENILKFVVGEKSIADEYADFQATCRQLGAEECIEAYQGAVTRFVNR